MSSTMDRRIRFESWLVILACVGFTIWYARGQLLYSLYFGYQVVRFFFPQWIPPVGG